MKDGEPLPAGGATELKPHAQLMSFYSVTTVDALIKAQEQHIKSLQAKLPKPRDDFPASPRHG